MPAPAWRWIAVSLFTGCLPFSLLHGADRFQVELRFAQGRLRCDRSTAAFPDGLPAALRPGVSASHLTASFCDAIDAQLHEMPAPYRFTLTDSETARDDAGNLHNSEIDAARTWNGDWKAFPRLAVWLEDTTPFENELAKVTARSGLQTLQTPLLFPDRKFRIEFLIRPVWRTAEARFTTNGRALSNTAFQKLARRWDGLPPDPQRIQQTITAALLWRESPPERVTVQLDTHPRQIILTELLQIRDLVWHPALDFARLDRILYDLFPGRIHKAWRAAGHTLTTTTLRTGASMHQIDLRELIRLAEGDTRASTFSYPQIDPREYARRAALAVLSGVQLDRNDLPDQAASQLILSSAAESPKPKRNFLGGGLEYRPGQGIRWLGSGRRLHSLGDDLLTAQGGAQGSGFGSASYTRDYLLFSKLHRRLALRFDGSTQFELRRILNGVLTDERRSGGSIGLEFEPWRHLSGSRTALQLDARRETVRLMRTSLPDHVVNLSTLTLGLEQLWQQPLARRPFRLRWNPAARFGLGQSATEPTYHRVTTNLSWHHILAGPLEYDLRLHGRYASPRTPVFELPSFGGEESVRGFRADDALGRKLWSSQSELWLPLWHTSSTNTASTFIARTFRLALFYDAGATYQTIQSPAGFRQGAGAGLRMKYRDIILAIDWAHGVGPAVSGNGRGRFYFHIRLP